MNKKTYIALSSVLFLLATVVYAATTGTLLPNGDGTYTQWTPSTGTTHFILVDESSCNGKTDYNSTNTIGNRDSYTVNISSVSTSSQITQIDILPCASRNLNGGGSSVMNVFYRLNGADSADAGAYALIGTTPTNLATTTFSALSTIKTSTTTLQIGAVLTSGNRGARLSRIAAVITYTPFSAPSGLGATTTSSSQIDLGWNDNSTFEEGYVVERRNNTASSTFATIATTTADTTAYNDSGLASSTSYSYRVRGFNLGGYSVYSNTATATTTP